MKKTILALIVVFAFCAVGISHAEELTPQMCKDKAIAAANLLKAEGEAAIAKIKDPNGEFRFADGKGYIWIHNLDGNMVMHPIKPSLDGKGLLSMKDVNGVYLFVAMNEIAEEYGAGWVPYSWPKPGEESSSSKVSYVVLAENGDNAYVAGAGMYDVTAEDVKSQFPDDPVYEDE